MEHQLTHHLRRCHGIRLVDRDHVGVGALGLTLFDGLGGHLPTSHHVVLAEFGALLEERHRGDGLIVHDVAECPFATHPRVDEGHLEAVLAEAAPWGSAALECRQGHRIRTRDARTRCLGQQGHDVVIPAGKRAFLAPDAVHGTRDHTLFLFSLQIRHHAAANELELLPL